jgi:hypothetical protein
LAVSPYAEAFGETGVGFRWLLVGNASNICVSLRTRLLILHWISYDASARPFGKRDALTEASVRIAWIHVKQKGVVTVCQAQQQILKASEQVLNTDTSRRCQLRSVVGILLCACVVALVLYGSVFAQAPSMERWGYDAQFGPDRPGAIYPHLGNDEVRLEPPRSVGNRLPASETVTLHELSHHVPGRAVKGYKRALKATNEGEKENAIAHYKKRLPPIQNSSPQSTTSVLTIST